MSKAKASHVSHTFPPCYQRDAEILILGSFPSIKSREEAFYYANPLNRFYDVLSMVFNEKKPVSLDEKKEFVYAHKLALYDVIKTCDIISSSDSSIKNVKPVDLSLIKAPIKMVVLNGKKAGALYIKYLSGSYDLPYQILPSTSPANAACSLKDLYDSWSNVLLKK